MFFSHLDVTIAILLFRVASCASGNSVLDRVVRVFLLMHVDYLLEPPELVVILLLAILNALTILTSLFGVQSLFNLVLFLFSGIRQCPYHVFYILHVLVILDVAFWSRSEITIFSFLVEDFQHFLSPVQFIFNLLVVLADVIIPQVCLFAVNVEALEFLIPALIVLISLVQTLSTDLMLAFGIFRKEEVIDVTHLLTLKALLLAALLLCRHD